MDKNLITRTEKEVIELLKRGCFIVGTEGKLNYQIKDNTGVIVKTIRMETFNSLRYRHEILRIHSTNFTLYSNYEDIARRDA